MSIVPRRSRFVGALVLVLVLGLLGACTQQGESEPLAESHSALDPVALPYQFIAKMYTEALGRAPDEGGWQGYVSFFAGSGCNQANLSGIAGGFFDSAEYMGKGYTPEEQVLTLYRAVLSREPDVGGFSTYVGALQAGWTPGDVARALAGSDELAALVGDICSGNDYRRDWGATQAIDIGSGSWDGSTLQDCVDQNLVCSVPPRTVVLLDRPLVIPAGHVLETAGMPLSTSYARQARLVRNFPGGGDGDQSLVVLNGDGATLRMMWLSGQRHLFLNGLDGNGVQANVHHAAGNGNTVWACRVEFPLRGTNFEVSSVGSLDIYTNLIVGYTSSHYMSGYAVAPWADGVSFHAPNGHVAYNGIIDPTDVGIVLFGHDGMVQGSEAWDNVIVHSGHSAYGSLGFDTIYNCNGCSFSGAGIHDNLIIAGQSQHSDIMLVIGTGPWYAPYSGGPTGAGIGQNAMIWNNRTIWGDEQQRVRVQQAIVVDGMLNAYVQGNGLFISPEPVGACYVPGASGYRVDPNDASGSLQDGWIGGPTHACVGH